MRDQVNGCDGFGKIGELGGIRLMIVIDLGWDNQLDDCNRIFWWCWNQLDDCNRFLGSQELYYDNQVNLSHLVRIAYCTNSPAKRSWGFLLCSREYYRDSICSSSSDEIVNITCTCA